MDVKNINNSFNDDFADLFNNADEMEIDELGTSQESINTTIKLLEDEKDLQKRLNIIQKLVNKFLPRICIEDLEEKLLRYLLPALKEFLNNVFDELCQLLTTANLSQKSVRTLNILQSYLQMCAIIYEMLNCTLDYTLHNQEIPFCKLYSLPLNIVEMLFITFQHCKQSDKLYQVYFEDLKEIFSLFKGAQDVHVKLLKLLEKHVDYNVLTLEEINLLKNVLEILSEMGSVLVDMNIKALADNWKGYLALTQKVSEHLNRSDFDIVKPMQFLTDEICRNINNVLKMDVKDQKGISQILKICNFFIRIILKLCETLWINLGKICRSALDFLSQIYEYYPPFLRYKGYTEVIVKEIDATIFDVSNQIIRKLVSEPSFYEELKSIHAKEINTVRTIFLFTTIIQNSSLICEERGCILCNSYYLIDIFLKVTQESYCEFFWKIQIPTITNQPPMRSLYNENVINISKIIVSLDQSSYRKVEHILLQNILQDCIWSALLATDIWCLCLSKRPSIVYETLLQILVKTRQFLSNNFTIRPEKIFLENLLKRLYSYLPEEFKCSLLERFPLPSNLQIWKCLGLQNFPQKQFYVVESLLINLTEKMENFKKGECNVDDFNFLCNSLEAISSLSNKNETNLKYLLSTLMKIWESNVKLKESLHKNALFEHFIDKLCQATNNFILNFSNQQLLSILLKLRYLSDSNSYTIKIRTGQILLSLSTRSFKLSVEVTQITTVLSEIFSILLHDKNPIIKEDILEVFIDFFNATQHEEVIQKVIRNDVELQNITSNFLQKEVNKSALVNVNEYFKKQKDYKFQHVCPLVLSKVEVEENNSQGKRKPATDRNEITVIMKRIKNDLGLLHKLYGKENLLEENVNDIVDILSKRIGFRI